MADAYANGCKCMKHYASGCLDDNDNVNDNDNDTDTVTDTDTEQLIELQKAQRKNNKS